MGNPTTNSRLSRDLIVVLITALAVFISSAFAITIALKELSNMSNSVHNIAGKQAKANSSHIKKKIEPIPTVKPITLLPRTIDKFLTAAYHDVPGSNGRAAEAIYDPDNINYQIVTPLSTYVKVSYHGSNSKAKDEIIRTLETRFPKDRGTLIVDGREAYTGYSNDYGGLLIGWAYNGFAIKTIVSYTNVVPSDPKQSLDKVGDTISLKIKRYIENKDSGKGDTAQ
ncbi:MAG: hypothetical protein AB1743_03905 [Actinomycetota bacterium]